MDQLAMKNKQLPALALIDIAGYFLFTLERTFGGTKYFCKEFMLRNFSCLYIFCEFLKNPKASI